MRHVTETGVALIKQFEGFSPTPYLCPAGYWTVGYGHVIKSEYAYPDPITEDHASQILKTDIEAAERAVLRLINVPLTDGQFDALVSFTFNLGGGALQRSTLRKKANREEHDEAADEFRKWVYAGGRKLPGLIRRRAAEAELYQS